MNAPTLALAGAKSVRTPTVLQIDRLEAGAACLGMILGHFGCWVPIEEVRFACGVSRDGSRPTHLLRAAESFGLDAKLVEIPYEQLGSVAVPYIIPAGGGHFVVIEAVLADGFRINDPALGRRTIPAKDVRKRYPGHVLTFKPGPGFVRKGHRPNLIRALIERLGGARSALLFIVSVSLLLVVPGIVLPGLTRMFVDDYLIGGRTEWLRPLLLSFAVAIAVQALLLWIQQRHLLRFEAKMTVASAGKFFWHLLHLPMEFFAQRYAGDLNTRVDSNEDIARLLSSDLVSFTVSLFTASFFALVMFTYDVPLALLAVVLAALNFVVIRVIWGHRRDSRYRFFQKNSQLQAAVLNGVANIESVKANGGEPDLFARWVGHEAGYMTLQQNMGAVNLIFAITPVFLNSLSAVLILIIGAFRVMQGSITIGELLALQILVTAFTTPLRRLADLSANLQLGVVQLARLDDVLNTSASNYGAKGTSLDAGGSGSDAKLTLETRQKLVGRVDLKDVTFGYARLDPPFIYDFNLSIRPGARIAIVGPTGSGKSTVAKLVAGLYRPWSGEICFDGVPVEEIDRRLITNSVALVDQDINLFSGTVRDNISLWNELLDESAIVEAAKDALIHETIAVRTEGYMSPVLERGRNFSGGECLRLEIARALAHRPTILILDEATAALDAITERQICDNIRRRGCTCLIVAHRLSTIRDCDEIIVMRDGQIVQRGTHQSLMAAGGEYARLVSVE